MISAPPPASYRGQSRGEGPHDDAVSAMRIQTPSQAQKAAELGPGCVAADDAPDRNDRDGLPRSQGCTRTLSPMCLFLELEHENVSR